jgi:primosomal protein N''
MTIKENEIRPPQTDDKISLKDLISEIRKIWNYILTKWRIITVVIVLCASLGLIYSSFKTPEYIAKLSFSVIEKSSSGGNLSAIAGQFGFNIGSSNGDIFSVNNVMELLQSRNLIERTLLSEFDINKKRCRLIDYYREINPSELPDTISFPQGLSRNNFSRQQDSLLYVLNKEITTKKLSVDRQKKDVNIIQITFYNQNELFAKLFIEKLISIVTEFYIQTKTQNIKINLAMMETQADSIRKEYEKALSAQAMSFDRNMNPSKKSVMVEQQKIQTTIQLTGTTYAELAKNIEIMKLDLAQQTPLIQIIDTPVMPLEVEQLKKIQGIIFGGIIGGILILTCLSAIYIYKRMMT